MGGVKNPFGGGNIGLGQLDPYVGLWDAGGKSVGKSLEQKDPAGMQQYTDLANQAQQEYSNQRQFMSDNVNPKRKDLINQLANQANGTAPSIAEAQLRSAFDKSLQQQLAMARSSRGTNPGLAARNVSNVAAQQQQNLAGQAAVARLQEQDMAQRNLQNSLNNEMQYATGTLGSALGSQANVYNMQNNMRGQRDARISNILNTGASMVGSFFGMAEGGKVPSYEQSLARKQPKKLAYGGQYQANVGTVEESKAPEQNASKSNPLTSIMGPMMGGSQQQQPPLSSFVPRMPSAGSGTYMPSYNQGGAVLDNVKKAKENMEDAEINNMRKNTQYTAHSQKGHRELAKRILAVAKHDKKRGNYSDGGEVEGTAEVKGDSFQNDKVPALLSPGEVVIPRSVLDKGAVAAGYFAKKAAEDESYNAKSFKAEKKTLAQMLKEINESEETYKKVSNMLKNKKGA